MSQESSPHPSMSIDLYRSLRELIDQIPEGMVATFAELADALGDRRAARSIPDMLKRGEFRDVSAKVVRTPGPGVGVFKDFSSERPLSLLAEFQREMAGRAVTGNLDSAELVAAADAAYVDDRAYAAACVMDRALNLLDSASAVVDVRFPYLAGYLSFMEAPALEAAVRQVSGFNVLMVNGHGVAHPRGCGLATHVGLDLDVPTIGVARSRLVGSIRPLKEGLDRLIYRGAVVGARMTLDDGPSLYVSVGHKVSLETAVEVVRRMWIRGNLPEPLRLAHAAASKLRSRPLSSST